MNSTIGGIFVRQSADGQSQWSRAACIPIYIAAISLAGILALALGFARYEIRPQLADLPDLVLDVQMPRAPIGFSGKGALGDRTIRLTTPPGAAGELVVHPKEQLALKPLGKGRFCLPTGQRVTLRLKRG